MVDFDKALEGLEDIRKKHNRGKEIFLRQLKSCKTIDDLKWIMDNHLIVFFDEMNFHMHMTKMSLGLIRDLNETFKKLPKTDESGEFEEGKVEKGMQGVIDEVLKFRDETSKQKEDEGIMNGKL